MAAEGSLLPQFLFASNLTKTVRIREKIPGDIERPSHTNGLIHHFKRLHKYTVELFRLSNFSPQFREKVQAALLDKALQTALEQLRNLNWCKEVTKLVPLKTNGDGNCLLHAASQFMWGVQDIDLALRKTLWEALKGTDTRNFKYRWQIEYVRSQQFDATGLHYDTKNWDEEWEKVVKMASAASNLGQSGLSYGSLEEIHIFVLANILRRPIIVIADRVVRSFYTNTSLAPVHFGGIYLPLHWPAQQCYRYPIIIGYDAQHFAPLVAVTDVGPEIRAVPLVHNERRRFEGFMIHFLMPDEEKNKDKLLKEYFNLIEIPVQGQDFGTTDMIKAARLDEGNLPEDLNLVEDYYQLVNHEFKKWQQSPDAMSRPAYQPVRMNPAAVQGSLIEEKCATRGCPYYCSVETKPFCHECFERANSRKNETKQKLHEQQKKKGSRPVRVDLVNAAIWPEPEPSSRPRSAPPTAPSLYLFSETSAMKCKVPTCPFTLNVQHNGLCEHCFKARTALPGNVSDNRTPELRLPHHKKETNSEQLVSPQENIRTKQGAVNPLQKELMLCRRCHQDVPDTVNGLCNACLSTTFPGNCNSSFEGTSSSHSGHERSHSDPCQFVKNTGLPPVIDQHQVSNLWPSINELQGSDFTQHSRGTHGSEEPRESVQMCKKPGCMYFGTPKHQGFCTLCFMEYRLNLDVPSAMNPNRAPRNQQRSHQPSPSDPRFQNMARCRGQDCETFGKTLFEGFCEKCFIAAQHQRIDEATGCRGQSNNNAGEQGRSDRIESRSQRIKCARNYCNNSVTTSTEELCLQCHQRISGSSQDPVESYLQKPRCQATGCNHFGNEKCNGYCNECYIFLRAYGGQ